MLLFIIYFKLGLQQLFMEFQVTATKEELRGWEGQETKRLLMYCYWSMMKNYLDAQNKEMGGN